MVAKNRKRNNDLDRYAVVLVPVDDISPSPENDDLYGEIVHDEQMDALIESIRSRGLEEPIILTADMYIVSGHRRYYAVDYLDWDEVPCRIKPDIEWIREKEFHRTLAEYNPQRIKSVGSLLKEALLREQSPEDTYDAIEEYHRAPKSIEVDFMQVSGQKQVRDVSEKKRPFLKAVQAVIESLNDYWPLSIRQIHYNLLNKPPLISIPKRSKFGREHYRYRNDVTSYNALVELLKSARYHRHIAMNVIDDPTRPQLTHGGYASVSEFVNQEIRSFLTGFHRNRQDGQPRHIELFCEKNTVYGILRRVAEEYYVPITAGRGFCSIPVWRDMARRFQKSGRDTMSLIVVSDWDPEGLELADDAVRSLRDLWGLPVEGHRICVTREQIDELDLAADFNPAKTTSKSFNRFVERTGGTESWELEALPPDYLSDQVRSAIEANMDMEIFNRIVEQEEDDAGRLWDIKRTIASQLEF